MAIATRTLCRSGKVRTTLWFSNVLQNGRTIQVPRAELLAKALQLARARRKRGSRVWIDDPAAPARKALESTR